MDPQQTITIDLASPLCTSPERDVTFQLPAVVSHRLDLLVQSLERKGPDAQGRQVTQRTTTRKELLAALILATDEQALESLLTRYRDARVGAALIPAKDKGRTSLPARRPGIRPTAEQERKRKRAPDRTPPTRNRSSEIQNGAPRSRAG